MSIKTLKSIHKRKGYIPLNLLLIFGFTSIFFSRVLELINFPSVVNLLHYGLIPFICFLALVKTKIKKNYYQEQITILKKIIFSLYIFFTINIISAFLNDAGLINACLNFLFFCEHFLLLLIILTIPYDLKQLFRLHDYIVYASLINLLFAYVQRYILKLHLQQGLEDNIQGIFIGAGAGHVVGVSVSLTFAIYYFVRAKHRPIWVRSLLIISAFLHMIIADAKQVLLVFLISGLLLLASKVSSIRNLLKYLIAISLIYLCIFWILQNIPAVGAGFGTWIRPEIYGPQGEATQLKTVTFRVIPTYYQSVLHPLFGLGPGHTVGRLGGWMLSNYEHILDPLGATVHPASAAVWFEVGSSWLGDQSSLFSPLFGWAGLWGDLGILGLAAFLYIWFIVWHQLCLDDFSRFLVLNVFVFGFIFTQMEEATYMNYIAIIIGFCYQKKSFYKTNYKRSKGIRLYY